MVKKKVERQHAIPATYFQLYLLPLVPVSFFFFFFFFLLLITGTVEILSLHNLPGHTKTSREKKKAPSIRLLPFSFLFLFLSTVYFLFPPLFLTLFQPFFWIVLE